MQLFYAIMLQQLFRVSCKNQHKMAQRCCRVTETNFTRLFSRAFSHSRFASASLQLLYCYSDQRTTPFMDPADSNSLISNLMLFRTKNHFPWIALRSSLIGYLDLFFVSPERSKQRGSAVTTEFKFHNGLIKSNLVNLKLLLN